MLFNHMLAGKTMKKVMMVLGGMAMVLSLSGCPWWMGPPPDGGPHHGGGPGGYHGHP